MPPISPWPDWLDSVWAKSSDTPGQPGESLALHTWRVLERLGDLANLRPNLPQQLNQSRLWNRLYWACLLHDLGKVAPGFQDRLRNVKETTASRQWGRHRHEVISLAFATWFFAPPTAGDAANPVTQADRRWVIAAIASHHRDAREVEELYPVESDEELSAILRSISPVAIDGIYRWLGECAGAWADALSLTGVQPLELPPLSLASGYIHDQGASRVRSLLREYHRWVRQLNGQIAPTTSEIILRGLILQADHTASAHTKPLLPLAVRTSELLSIWNMSHLYEHQNACSVILHSAVLTAPTGSGKTEAALLWAARQTEITGRVPRLFYALPFQASMNAMYLRLSDTLTTERVGLQHGRAQLALYRFAMDQQPNPARATRQARWRSDLARLSYYPVRVFSPYQMLKTMYRLKGYEALLLDYYGASFIFDEIHAYAPERLGLLLALVEHLRIEFKARFLVMSATLPRIARAHVTDAIGDNTNVTASEDIYREFRRHRLNLLDGDLLDHLDRVAQTARQGASVLVCCNTVKRAQDAWRQLCTLLPGIEVVLLHGRFNGRDRLARENIVREATGSRSIVRRPIVLVATQVVEVSLDIDLDTIFSDPAPLEALIQRFGRINRRRMQRDLATVYVFREPTDGQFVYDSELVQASLAVLERANGTAIDEAAVDIWLDEIYQGRIATEWEAGFQKSLGDGRRILSTLRPFQSDDSLADLFDAAFDSVEVLPSDLAAEYEPLREDNPILASSLLVSISDRRRKQLWHQGLIRANTHPPVVEVPYSKDIGLDFDGVSGSGE